MEFIQLKQQKKWSTAKCILQHTALKLHHRSMDDDVLRYDSNIISTYCHFVWNTLFQLYCCLQSDRRHPSRHIQYWTSKQPSFQVSQGPHLSSSVCCKQITHASCMHYRRHTLAKPNRIFEVHENTFDTDNPLVCATCVNSTQHKG